MDASSAKLNGQTRKSSNRGQTALEQPLNSGAEILPSELSELIKNSCIEKLGEPLEDVVKNSNIEQSKPPEDVKISSLEQLGEPSKDAVKNSSRQGCKNKRTSAKLLKKKYMLRSSLGSSRALRSRSQEKPEAAKPSSNLVTATAGRKHKRKERRKVKNVLHDEFSKARKHLRYLLNRMSYEQSLIDAYSGEGWKRLSVDKLKPEKELQRAKSEIFRCKLKIRDLFQHIDSSCAEGRLPEVLFDDDEQIDSEDIFCAKCGSKDVSAGNDIILCDGACERGFHQLCLEPPLLKVPPGDEGWLCPGCDCKVDCIDLLNDSQGTNLSIKDSWEKVFPEATPVAAGEKHNDSFGSSTDDSEDNDYDPDGPEDDQKVVGDESNSDESDPDGPDDESTVQGDELSSDVSDFTSASGDLEVFQNDNQYMGLPSDDSEDDDYDPDGLDLDEQNKPESSSSDFTSDSEDLTVAFDDTISSFKRKSSDLDHSEPTGVLDDKKFKLGGNEVTLNDELSSVLESAPGHDGSATVSEKRHVERLDYKKLYDEAYGNNSSDSSDDEDWTDTDPPRKKMKNTRKVSPMLPNRDFSSMKNGSEMKDIKDDHNISEHTSRRRTCQKLAIEGTHNSSAKSSEGSPGLGSSGGNTKRQAYNRLGDAVTQTLYKYFWENQYPDRVRKENIGRELGITVKQVNKWFQNTRWSFYHPPCMEACKDAQSRDTSTPHINKKHSDPNPKVLGSGAACNGADNAESTKAGTTECSSKYVGEERLVTGESSKQNSTTPSSRRQKGKSDQSASVETPNPPADLSEVRDVKTTRARTRNRRSVA